MGVNVGGVDVETYTGSGLKRETNWWGAFVVGLAGTILVTGVVGPVLGGMGGAAIPNFFFVTLTGWLLCLFLAELAAMLPDRTGGRSGRRGRLVAATQERRHGPAAARQRQSRGDDRGRNSQHGTVHARSPPIHSAPLTPPRGKGKAGPPATLVRRP